MSTEQSLQHSNSANQDTQQPQQTLVPQEVHPLNKMTLEDSENPETISIVEALYALGDFISEYETDIGRTPTIKHRIILTDDKPVHRPPYRRAIRNASDMEATINRLLVTGAIRHSTSPYASPVFFVDKDHGRDRGLVADYRALNAKTVPNRMPMPHPEDVFALLHGMKIYVKLDITSMFNQIQVDKQDIEKNAITTPFGLLECPLIPFWLINAPATAVRLMREVLRGLDMKICFVYLMTSSSTPLRYPS